ncbi:hypothetical protein QJS10_CPB19g01038 [Acorus calamus]|uniref:Uncharacterized protein n=1 Tax=Acorus calamus TaxID=4465 RepID=A0AAV9CEP5_ACOCL|nr:hypothetical protein QJS10_CPB19g01038 [Acorus calamus]
MPEGKSTPKRHYSHPSILNFRSFPLENTIVPTNSLSDEPLEFFFVSSIFFLPYFLESFPPVLKIFERTRRKTIPHLLKREHYAGMEFNINSGARWVKAWLLCNVIGLLLSCTQGGEGAKHRSDEGAKHIKHWSDSGGQRKRQRRSGLRSGSVLTLERQRIKEVIKMIQKK